eukprot:4127331-Amphidinium_carterae.3
MESPPVSVKPRNPGSRLQAVQVKSSPGIQTPPSLQVRPEGEVRQGCVLKASGCTSPPAFTQRPGVVPTSRRVP